MAVKSNLGRDLIARIERFLARHRMAETRFGKIVCGDPSFVMRVRSGRNIRIETFEKVDRFLKEDEQCQGKSIPKEPYPTKR